MPDCLAPVCDRRWRSKWLDRLNAMSHWKQMWGFSCVCSRWCCLKLPAWLNDRPQSEQLYGLTPVWTSWCRLKLPSSLNDLSHIEQMRGFVSVCRCRCLFKLLAPLYELPQSGQLKALTPVACISNPAQINKQVCEVWDRTKTDASISAYCRVGFKTHFFKTKTVTFKTKTKTLTLQDQDSELQDRDQDQDFKNWVSRRLETKTQAGTCDVIFIYVRWQRTVIHIR